MFFVRTACTVWHIG